uniref:ferredoxin--NADP(+) reductase n=1 Tax=Thalassionema nitzschioides TaxID=33649 RepID=A0A7S1H572_9STRA|mmetsp:Transcript_8675/g.7122  ORF Transcript_8675/g.7122 Transcript_8675/m.7122 type:complete len:421 (+) Transcript_8675:35-1297(+)
MMMKNVYLAFVVSLLSSASAFVAPLNQQSQVQNVALNMVDDRAPSKKQKVWKAMKRTTGALATVALSTAGLPPIANAAAEVVETAENAKKILAVGAGVATAVAASKLLGTKKQNFLEASPYWDQSTIPLNTFKNKAPFTGKVVSTKRIVGPKATGETCHIIIDSKGDYKYWEGQSMGVIPPGNREKDGKPHAVSLYSIASTRYGDDMTGKTSSLCVRRATYWCPELKADDPAKKGICSNFLCDTKPGDDIVMTGPAGKVMLMPEEDPSTNYIMVATGTGIAPYRGFVRRLFIEKTPAAEAYKGEAWLFLGVANSDALLYDDEWQEVKENFPDNFRLDYALSREQENKKGGKMYIQDKMEEYADEIFNKLDAGAHIYFCGLKGMMPGIQDMLKGVADSKGMNYDEWLKGLKSKKQWHVEVY